VISKVSTMSSPSSSKRPSMSSLSSTTIIFTMLASAVAA
jgi:hypothetical protein